MLNIENFSLLKAEPQWLLDQRLAAYNRLPIKEDAWILESFEDKDPRGYGVLAQLDQVDNLIIQYGNETIFEQISLDLQAAGVIVCDLFEALQTYPQLLEGYLNTSFTDSPEDLLHQAYLNCGLFIYVPEALKVDLNVIFVTDKSLDQVAFRRILILQDPQAQVHLKKSYQDFGQGDTVGGERAEKFLIEK